MSGRDTLTGAGPSQLPRHVERTPGGRIRTEFAETPGLDRAALARELEAAIKGEVRFDTSSEFTARAMGLETQTVANRNVWAVAKRYILDKVGLAQSRTRSTQQCCFAQD